MKKINIVKAWKDSNYRESLSKEELESLPKNPAGNIELDSDELKQVNGGDGNPDAPLTIPISSDCSCHTLGTTCEVNTNGSCCPHNTVVTLQCC